MASAASEVAGGVEATLGFEAAPGFEGGVISAGTEGFGSSQAPSAASHSASALTGDLYVTMMISPLDQGLWSLAKSR